LDIEKELNNFSQKIIPQLSVCKELNYYKTVTRFDDIAFKHSIKKLKLSTLSKQVDSIFLQKAIRELHYENRANAFFFLDKSLQYNPVYPDALLLKIQLLFEEDDYQGCLSLLHTLYYEAPLQRKHEIEISSFNILFYNKLYHVADSLIKIEKATEALDLFKTLETFCTNMPVEYCNDDYYHGILRSRKGVYESYLIIAKVATEKGNKEIAQKFLDYAEEYRIVNQNELPAPIPQVVVNVQDTVVNVQDTVVNVQDTVVNVQDTIVNVQDTVVNVQDTIVNVQDTESEIAEEEKREDKTLSSEETVALSKEPQPDIEATVKKYNQLLIQGMTFVLDNNFKKAYEVLKEALELENCNCFSKDERVQILYNTLHKAYSK